MDWIALFIAGIFEVVWVVGLKYSEGFSKLWPSVLTFIAMGLSFVCLSYAMKTLPMGTSYAIWTGIGACGAVIFGMLYLGESRELIRVICLLLIVGSILTLKVTHA